MALGQSKTLAQSKFCLPVSNYTDTVYTLMQLRIETFYLLQFQRQCAWREMFPVSIFKRASCFFFTLAFNLQEEKEGTC